MGADVVQEHCYMDDLMPSTPTVDEEKETTKQPTELRDLVGFHIRKWIWNEPDVTAWGGGGGGYSQISAR